jgi:ferric-dicitrate binding protein FerR (iron transport regulator)
VLPGQTASQPLRGQNLPSDSVIKTNDGQILLKVSDGSQVLIYPHTEVVLKEPSFLDPNYLKLLLGRIRAQVSKRTGGSPSFQLGTPSAVITVRGTRFWVEVNPARVTEVDVFEGVVEVSGVHQLARSIVLEPGFSTRVSLDGDPESPVPTDEIRPDVQRGGEDTNDSKSEPGRETEIPEDLTQPLGSPTPDQMQGEFPSGDQGQDGPNH